MLGDEVSITPLIDGWPPNNAGQYSRSSVEPTGHPNRVQGVDPAWTADGVGSGATDQVVVQVYKEQGVENQVGRDTHVWDRTSKTCREGWGLELSPQGVETCANPAFQPLSASDAGAPRLLPQLPGTRSSVRSLSSHPSHLSATPRSIHKPQRSSAGSRNLNEPLQPQLWEHNPILPPIRLSNLCLPTSSVTLPPLEAQEPIRGPKETAFLKTRHPLR